MRLKLFADIFAGKTAYWLSRICGYKGTSLPCSYLYGFLLPKNARLTDYLISLALKRRRINVALNPLESVIEDQTCLAILGRMGFKHITNQLMLRGCLV